MHLLPLAIATMTLAQILDLGTFVAMVQRIGLGGEANPLVAGMVEDWGLPIAAVAKLAVIALTVAVAVVLTNRTRRTDRALGVAVVAVAIAAGLVGGGSNVATMGSLPLAR